MPTEYVLLCDREPDTAWLAELCEQRYPGGALLEAPGVGVRQFIDPDRGVIASFFAAQPIGVPFQAVQAIAGSVDGYATWIEVTVPHGDPGEGRALAEAVADGVGGTIREKR